jgi:hypothetical protein
MDKEQDRLIQIQFHLHEAFHQLGKFIHDKEEEKCQKKEKKQEKKKE